MSRSDVQRFEVNLIVNNKDAWRAGRIRDPTYNLFGGSVQGQLGVSTDFTMVAAVHKANGGYLIINALDMLGTSSSTIR